MKKIALICARKNSERAPNKNVSLLNDLITYTSVAKTKILTIFLNSDDDRVLEIAKQIMWIFTKDLNNWVRAMFMLLK